MKVKPEVSPREVLMDAQVVLLLSRKELGYCTTSCCSAYSQGCALGKPVGYWLRISSARGIWDGLSG